MSKGNKIIVLIPARYGSSRFPGKSLTQIAGKSLIQRVYENCENSGFSSYIVTDHQKIEDHARTFTKQVLRVDDDVHSGSDRIWLAYKRNFYNEFDLIINVQGDEPLLSGELIKNLADFHFSKSDFNVSTLLKERTTLEHWDDPHVVKAIWTEEDGACHYFSRESIPYRRYQSPEFKWYQHIGVYAFSPIALECLVETHPTYLEKTEGLEQLRLLGTEHKIAGLLTEEELIGVDTPEDIKKIEGVLSGKK